mgnify:CR=1 FL=1
MKAMVLGAALVLPLAAEEVEGTVWYDANGEVALVEGPAAEPAPRPFVPEWRKRELEREARRRDPLRWQERDRHWDRGWYGGYSGWGYRTYGWSVRPIRATGSHLRACFGGGRSGASVIIRW